MSYIYNLTDTWNSAGTSFTAIKMNVTDTASAAGSRLIDLLVNGTSKLYLDKNGALVVSGSVSANTLTLSQALALSSGGTGATTAAGARVSILPSLSANGGKVLAVNAGATDVEWITLTGGGTVTSVNASGGSTGLTFGGGPVTTSGTLTLGGVLALASGGTGAITPAAARVNLLPAYAGNATKLLAINSAGTDVEWVTFTGAAEQGANTDITSLSGITGGISSPDYIQFDTAATVTPAIGRLYFDSGNGGLSYVLKGGNVVQEVGQSQQVLVYNGTGSTINKGQVVYMNGAQGQRPSVALAIATSDTTSARTLGLAAENIANGAEGWISTLGIVENIDTSAFTEGTQLYLSGTVAGGLTGTKPSAPTHMVYVARCIKSHASAGRLFVTVQNGYELDELHDVSALSPSNGQTIVYNSTTSLWEKNTVSLTIGVNGILPMANGGTGSGTASGARTNLGATTVGGNLFTLANPSAVTFLRVNADNTVSALDAATFRTAIGAGTSSATGTVTSVATGTGLSGGTITTSGTISLANTAVTPGTYTNATVTVDAQGRITSASSGSGFSGVTSFNTRTGAVTLTSSDVTTALTYTPANKAGDTFTGAIDMNGNNISGINLINGGFGSWSTAGTLDWNDVSNAKSGQGYSLLLGTATNGPGGSLYYHPFNFEYNSKDGSGNITQLGIAYGSPGYGLMMRGRYSGTWSGWVEFLNSSTGAQTKAGILQSNASVRAPTFYDSDNTAYYVDPTGTSNLSGLVVASRISGGISGDAQRLYNHSGANNDGLQYWNMNNNATLNPNTGYWFGLRMGHGDADTYYSGTLAMNFFADDIYFRRKVNNVDQTWRRLWSNADSTISASGDLRAPIFYDSDDTNYYLNPNGSSNIKRLNIQDDGSDTPLIDIRADDGGPWAIRLYREDLGGGPQVYAADANAWYFSHSIRAASAAYAPIFYDEDNTAYYLNPNGASNLSSVTVNSRLTVGAHRKYYLGVLSAALTQAKRFEIARIYIDYNDWHAGGTTFVELHNYYYFGGDYQRWSISYDYNNVHCYLIDGASPRNRSAQVVCSSPIQMSGDFYYISVYVDVKNYSQYQTYIETSWPESTAHVSGQGGAILVYTSPSSTDIVDFTPTSTVFTNNILESGSSMRAPVFYDNDNTTYYIDAASTSVLNGITAGSLTVGTSPVMRGRGSGGANNIDWNTLGNDQNTIYEMTQETFNLGTGSGNTNFPAARSYSYGTLINFGANNSARAQVFISHAGNDLIFRGGWTNSSWQTWNKVLTDQNYTSYGLTTNGMPSGSSATNTVDVRAPIFYDSDNTNYKIDAASTSNLNILQFNSFLKIAADNSDWASGNYIRGGSDHLVVGVQSGGTLYLNYGNSSGSYRLYGSGYLNETLFTSGNTVRATTYYDSNDTSYYLDPASTTTSLQVAGTIEQGNNYAHPNIEWAASGTSTGMVIFSLPGTTSNYGMVHMVFDIYEYTGAKTATVILGGHNWSPSWYNTGCQVIGYTDKQVRLGVKDGRFVVVFGTSGSSWEYGQVRLRKIHNGSYYNNIMDLGGDWSASQTTTESFTNITSDLRNLRTPVNMEVDNIGYAYGSFRSPIFYDHNDTTYYMDPSTAGTSLKLGGSAYFGLAVDGDGVIINHDQIWTPTSNFHIQYSGPGNLQLMHGGGSIKVGPFGTPSYKLHVAGTIYSDTDVRTPRFYDSDNTGYYIDAASTSILNVVKANVIYNEVTQSGALTSGTWYTIAINNGDRATGKFTVVDGTSGLHQSFTFYANHHFGNDGSNSINVVSNSFYAGAPITHIRILDGSTYEGAALQVLVSGSPSNVSVYLNDDYQTGGWSLVNFVANSSNPGITNWANLSERSRVYLSGDRHGVFNSYHGYALGYDSTTRLQASTQALRIQNDYGYVDFGPQNSSFCHISTDRPQFYFGQNIHANGVYYDYNNTAYYLDAASSTALYTNGLIVAGTEGFQSRYYSSGARNRIWSFANADGYGLSYFQGTAGLDGSSDTIGMHFGTATSAASQFAFLSSGYARATNSWRAPIFYDSDNTGYYVNPNGVSAFSGQAIGALQFRSNPGNNVYLGATNSPPLQAFSDDGGAAYMSFHRSSAYAVNFGLDPDNNLRIGGWSASANRWTLDMSGNNWAAGSFRAPVFYDSDNTGYYLDPASTDSGNMRGYMYFGDYGAGIVGSYSSYRYQLVFAMGSAYKGTLDGTAVTGGYGLWYSHPNAGGVAANLSTHGLMSIVNGAWHASFGDSIRCVTDMRTPIYYDSNDTGYYSDPNSLTRANQVYANYISAGQSINTTWNIITGGTTAIYLNNSGYGQAEGSWRAPIFYDSNDTAYYTNPNGTSVMSSIALGGSTSVPQGVIWANGDIWTTGNGRKLAFSTDGSADTIPNGSIRCDGTGAGDIVIQNWSGSGSNDNFWIYGAGRYSTAYGSMRSSVFYDADDTSYYQNPNSDSSMYSAKFWGNSITIRGGSPTIHLQDTDHNSAMLHNNSNLFYVLRGGNDTTSWSQVGGYWPVYWDLTNNNATFGGSIWAAGDITAYSDIKLKDNIENIDNALDKTLRLRGVYYTLKRDEEKVRKLGVIAQEVQEVIPEVVQLHQDKEDPEGTLAVDYGHIVGLLIEAIKEQQTQINEIKATLIKVLGE